MTRISKTVWAGIPIVILTLTCAIAFAQTISQISGRVTDASGAILPGVDVTATQTATGQVRMAITNELGLYSMPSLPVGPYRLEVSLPGFRTFVQTGIVLEVGASLTIDAALEVGGVTESVEVLARSEVQVETRTMSVGEVIESERILELPLAGRQVTDLIRLAGAAVPDGGSPGYSMNTGVRFAVAGGGAIETTLDGAIHVNRFDGTNMPAPFPDALGEFRVDTGTQEAGQIRGRGGSVDQVTRSGTNEFHGALFWFGRNEIFNARQSHAVSRDPLKRNQFGGTIGGPIRRDRLFFFTGYQSTITRQAPSDTLSIVPTAAMLAGDWTAFNKCYTPQWRDTDLASGLINPARYSPAAVRVAARLPRPQNECGELKWGVRGEQHDKQFITRSDYQHTATHTIFGRYMITQQDSPVRYDESNLLTAVGAATGFNDRHDAVVLGNNWVLSPAAVFSSRFSYNRLRVHKQGAEFFNPQDVGIGMWSSLPRHFELSVAGSFSIGGATTALREMFQEQFQAGADMNLIHGGHQIGFGGTWAIEDIHSLHHTRSVGNLSVTAQNTGNAMGDFMLGRLNQIRQSAASELNVDQPYVGAYVQDTWRAASRLTLMGGLRWEPYFPQRWRPEPILEPIPITPDPYGGIRVYNFRVADFMAGRKSVVFPTAPAGFVYAAQTADGSGPADFEGRAAVAKKWSLVSPRIGIAWDPMGRGQTAVRASFGLAYSVESLSSYLNVSNNAPWSGDAIHPGGTLDDPWRGIPGGNPFPYDWRTDPKFIEGSIFLPLAPELVMPYTQSWTLSLQQQIGNWRVTADYIGSQSVKQQGLDALNPAIYLTQATYPQLFTGTNTCVLEGQSYTPCNTAGNRNLRRELRLWAAAGGNANRLADAKAFSSIDEFRSNRTGNYHGLRTSIRGSLPGVTLNANHTWSHCISDRVGGTQPGTSPQIVETRDRANCSTDRRHIFNMTAVAGTPRFARPVLRAVASDWRLSVIYRVESGQPLTISSGTDTVLAGVGNSTANQLAADVYVDRSGKLGSQFLNRSAFATPALGTWGNMSNFNLRGFHDWAFDAALSRSFSVSEAHRAEVRFEAFNVTNTPIPSNPEVSISSSTFGQVRSMKAPRIMQFALKYIF